MNPAAFDAEESKNNDSQIDFEPFARDPRQVAKINDCIPRALANARRCFTTKFDDKYECELKIAGLTDVFVKSQLLEYTTHIAGSVRYVKFSMSAYGEVSSALEKSPDNVRIRLRILKK